MQIGPFGLAFKRKIQKEYLTLDEAIRANLHGNKRILKWRQFWNVVYLFLGTGFSREKYRNFLDAEIALF